ncbi:MAG TPA: oligosaccharide repeat unit polymerase [Halomicronema sp.]
MSLNVLIPSCLLIGLIIFSIKKWAFKGEIFHPALIYTLVNAGMFVIFAFGPYIYTSSISPIYYYVYAFSIIAFVTGIVWGELSKSKTFHTDIKLNAKQLSFLYLFVLSLRIFELVRIGISSNFSLEDAAANRLYQGALAAESTEAPNVAALLLSTFDFSATQIATTIFVAFAYQRKKYVEMAIVFIVFTLLALFQNSRTLLFYNFFMLLIPIYTLIKDKTSLANLFKEVFIKNSKKIFIGLMIFTVVILVLTNTRSGVLEESLQKNQSEQQRNELFEKIYSAKKKDWFALALDSSDLSPSVVNPLIELSLYSGGTVASGGVTSRIATDTGLNTWGLRNYFVFHRILAQLRLDGGFSEAMRDHYYEIRDRAILEIPAILTGWLGEPGNWIMDFGYLGAPIASAITGWIIGWMYGRLFQAGPVLYGCATCVFAFAMLLSPSISFFGTFFSNSFSFFFFLWYLSNKRFRKKLKYDSRISSR